MGGPPGGDVTRLLNAWCAGDPGALEKLTPLVYQELHRRARRYMANERDGHTLQTTALVNEVYLRLVDTPQQNWSNRSHFYAVCAQLMRRVLVDFARSRNSRKRGAGVRHLPLDEALSVYNESPAQIIAVDEALKNLARVDTRKSRVVELRFFGGLSVDETAQVMKISPETVMRDWKTAKVWLLREISGSKQDGA